MGVVVATDCDPAGVKERLAMDLEGEGSLHFSEVREIETGQLLLTVVLEDRDGQWVRYKMARHLERFRDTRVVSWREV